MTTLQSPSSSPAQPPARKLGRPKSRMSRANKDRAFVSVCITAAVLSVVTLLVLLGSIFYTGFGRLTWQFFSGTPSRFVEQAGIWPAMAGTMSICFVCAITAVPIGVATAILLEEFKPRSRILQKLHGIIQLNITNLAGVPSIVYGILGLTAFAQLFNIGNPNAPMFEIGATYYDRYVLVDGSTASIKISGQDAAPVAPSAAMAFMDDKQQPKQVKIVSADEIGTEVRRLEDRLDVFEAGLEERIDELRAITSIEALDAEAVSEWKKAEFTTALSVAAPGFAEKMKDAIAKPGREGKKALRVVVKDMSKALAASRFPNTLLSTAEPSRVKTTAPWYLRIPFGRSVLAGGLTLMLVILPIIIISTQEALRAVSNSQRQASLALGATKWQTIWNITLPSAMPGVMTGVILSMSRAIGEAAPVLIIAGIVYITFIPRHLMDDFTAMPLQIYQWASLPQKDFHEIAAAGIILLLAILLLFNGVAIYIRQRTQRSA